MLHYRLNKHKGKTILFLHGFCEDSRMWQYFMRGFSKEYQILRIDLPGFGKSPISKKTSIADMAERVKEVLDHLKINKVFFIGHSMGGYVALAFAKKYGNNLEGLGLFHSHPFADSDEKKLGRTKSAELIRKGGQKIYVKEVINFLFPSNYSNQKQVETLIRRAREYPAEGISNALEAMRDRPDNSAVLENIKCPVLFIVGTEDNAVPASFSREQTCLASLSDIHILEGIGHMGMFENSKNTKQILFEFVDFCKIYP